MLMTARQRKLARRTVAVRQPARDRLFVLTSACFALACSNNTHSSNAAGLPSIATQWWRSGVCYEVFVRSFADADGDGVGDLRGLISRLDYINDGNPASTTSLGANCIWLMPIDKSMSYHGYDVVDYYHVDPRYGTDDDFRNLVTEAHKRGIHVIVDFVPNHTGSQSPWFQAALHDPGSQYRDWYRWSKTLPVQKGPWGQEAWHKSPVRDEYYYGVFWHEMPDLNYENRAVGAEMQKVLTYWLKEMHADGFRFDAIPYLVEDGEQLQHSRGTHDVLRQLGNTIRTVSSGSFSVGEMTDESPGVMETYYPDQLDSYFAFGVAKATMQAAATGDASGFFDAVLQANSKFPSGRWSPFLSNHDQPRVMTVLGDAAKARVAASAMLMLPGMPFVYYGEEIGMIGPKPDERIRTPMQWSSGAGAGFTTGTPWEAPTPDWVSRNVAAQDGDSASLLNHYRRLIHLRNQHPALSGGDLQLGAPTDKAVAAMLRRSPDETILIALNFSDRLIDSVSVVVSPPPRGGQYRLERLYSDPSNACVVIGILSGGTAITFGHVAPHSLCTFRVLPN
jgi:alpha-amylase